MFEKKEQVWLTTAELAERWHMKKNTLEIWRSKKIGVSYHRFGKRQIRYHLYKDIKAFEERSGQAVGCISEMA